VYHRLLAACAIALVPRPGFALTLSEVDRDELAPGVTVVQYRTSSPTTDAWVASIDLCAEGIRLDATRAPSSTRTAASWGGAEGALLAVNGDFYRTSPVRVYGDAVGAGVRWPLYQTGLDPAYAAEWYAGDFGWVAFGSDWMEFTHTGWAQDHWEELGLSEGWAPGERLPDPPDNTLALVSGFPALVIEGEVVTCDDPTASPCFVDRSDMRDRHPRTAIGLTEDRSMLHLAVVDGRTSRSAGMYGTELADLMGQIGAWQAFNLDGGGSTQMWSEALGTLNNPSDGSPRAVANHLGVFTVPHTGASTRPWHCPALAPCEVLPPAGGVLDEAGDCFQAHGPDTWWREESGEGEGGSLVWTNQWTSDHPLNWAWWRINLAQAGEYRVEWRGSATYSVARGVRHRLRAGGTDHVVEVDLDLGDGWHELGTFAFDEGGDQFLAIDDDASGSVGSDPHIAFDAIRLTRVGSWCGDGTCDADEDCSVCPEDCPPVEEVAGNGLDDDCDGDVDEAEDSDGSGDDGADTDGTWSEPEESVSDSGTDTADTDRSSKNKDCGCSGSAGGGMVGAWASLLVLARRRRTTHF
jgi:hypothetical protein